MASNGGSSSNSPKEQLPRGLVNKSGAPVNKSARLPSARQNNRDLTLGGSVKKSFKPTIPARPREKVVASAIEDKLETKQRKPKRERTERDGKGKGRKGHDSKHIQSTSIFEQGMAERVIKRESIYSSTERRATSTMKIGSGSGKENKAETEKLYNRLLRDDYIDGEGDDLSDITEQPVSLPLLTINKLKLEQEEVTVTQSTPVNLTSSDDPANCTSILENIEEQMKLLLVQLPDTLPGLKNKDEQSRHQQSGESSRPPTSDQCSLSDLSEGKIGKIRLYKSGRMELLLGDHVFDVNKGVPTGYLQEALYLHCDREMLTGIGSIKEKLVVIPNIDHMLDS